MSDGTLTRKHRFTVLPEPLLRDRRVSDRAMRLWCLLDRYAGANGQAFPKRKRLAGDLDCSVATLDRAMEELVATGWLHKARREEGGVNDYTLLDGAEGLLTHEDTPTSEDTDSSSTRTPPLAGDDTQKEASLSEPEPSETSELRSGDELTEQECETGRDAEGALLTGKRRDLLANAVTQAWWEWAKARDSLPAQSFISCRQIIKTALANGVPPKRIKFGLGRLTTEARPVSAGSLQIAMTAAGPQHPQVDDEHRAMATGRF